MQTKQKLRFDFTGIWTVFIFFEEWKLVEPKKVERGFLNLCELVQRQQKQWAHNTQQ